MDFSLDSNFAVDTDLAWLEMTSSLRISLNWLCIFAIIFLIFW